MGTFRATVEYDGTRYSGFQVQVGRPTIQGELERSLGRITQQHVRVEGAGRTDSGVHARGQVISFAAEWAHSEAELQRAMNATLPDDIAVRQLVRASDGFHARYSALAREYVYQVLCSPVRAPLWERYAYRLEEPLDLSAMQQAGQLLVGRHDYAAFGQPPAGENTVRTVYHAGWWREIVGARGVDGSGDALILTSFAIEADAFLRGMVRRLVGTLLQVGSGRLSTEQFGDILLSRDISRAAPPAPARGLILWRVRYEHQDAHSGVLGGTSIAEGWRRTPSTEDSKELV